MFITPCLLEEHENQIDLFLIMNYGKLDFTTIACGEKKIPKRRNVWTDDEISLLLDLLKEKKILGLLDSKRMRNKELFKALEEPMKRAGFVKDASMMQIKFKNLKGEYYKCKRASDKPDTEPANFTFFHLMDELLDHRPAEILGSGYTSELVKVKEEEDSISPIHLLKMDIATINSGEKKRRNVWTEDEISLLLDLMKEKKSLGLLDGKRIRNKELFKTLEEPMKQAGFIKDASMMQIKFKNLKGEYYKCKRHNDKSGSDPAKFTFFDIMEDLLDHRPVMRLRGVDTNEQQTGENEEETYPTHLENIYSIPFGENADGEVVQAKIEFLDMLPQPSTSTTPPSCSSSNTPIITKTKTLNFRSRKKVSRYQKTLDKLVSLQKEMNNSLKVIATEMKRNSENVEVFLNNLLGKQEAMLTACTNQLLEGLKSLQHHKKNEQEM